MTEKEKVWERLEGGILLNWSPHRDNKVFHLCLISALKEVQKVRFPFFFLFSSFFSFTNF